MNEILLGIAEIGRGWGGVIVCVTLGTFLYKYLSKTRDDFFDIEMEDDLNGERHDDEQPPLARG